MIHICKIITRFSLEANCSLNKNKSISNSSIDRSARRCTRWLVTFPRKTWLCLKRGSRGCLRPGVPLFPTSLPNNPRSSNIRLVTVMVRGLALVECSPAHLKGHRQPGVRGYPGQRRPPVCLDPGPSKTSGSSSHLAVVSEPSDHICEAYLLSAAKGPNATFLL